MFGFALIPRPPDGLIGLAARFLSRWSRVRCLTLAPPETRFFIKNDFVYPGSKSYSPFGFPNSLFV